jgi:transglutaminase superfamily protein
MSETEWVEPGVMTDAGKYAGLVKQLPKDAAGVARVVQGLLIHEFWADAYGVTLTDEDRDRVNLRRAEQVLDAIVSRDDRPLDVPRAPAERIASNCRGFSVLAVALFRAHGVPARARCGFGGYFTPGFWEDHWVVEYYEDDRWKRGDAQIDAVQRPHFTIDFDLADLPPGAFLTGGEAWERFRQGSADPATFGLSSHASGDWWIAGNLVRDLAAMDNVEVLPWDCWDPMPKPDSAFDPSIFDHLDSTKVPDTVYNAVRDRVESFT